MPNWCSTELTITGDKETLAELKEQMRQPYQVITQDWKTREITTGETKGEFLLWNAIRPTDPDTYFDIAGMKQRLVDHIAKTLIDSATDKPVETATVETSTIVETIKANLAEMGKVDFSEMKEKFEKDIAENDDWYHWNLRNWGTKWDISEAWVNQENETTLVYSFSTAWSPCAEAITHLAKQYPTLRFGMFARDEGGMFTCEIQWAEGRMVFDQELPESHEMNMRLNGYCWACDENDPDYADSRAELGCEVSMVVPDSVPNV